MEIRRRIRRFTLTITIISSFLYSSVEYAILDIPKNSFFLAGNNSFLSSYLSNNAKNNNLQTSILNFPANIFFFKYII